MTNLIIDSRESSLYEEYIKLGGQAPVSKQLDIGDILIQNDDTCIIIERKTVADLIASIKDGRYKEQSMRLMNHPDCHPHNIIYLIEGSIEEPFKQMVHSAMFSLNHYKGFSVYRSKDVADSAYIISNIISKLDKRQYKPKYSNDQEKNKEKNAEKTVSVSMKKNGNITPENIGIYMLCNIPGVNIVTAEAIMLKYNNISSLIVALKSEGIKSLEDVKTSNGRKISKTCIAKIVEFLG